MNRRTLLVGLVALVGMGCEYIEPKKFGLTTAERKPVYPELLREYQRHRIPGPGPWDETRAERRTGGACRGDFVVPVWFQRTETDGDIRGSAIRTVRRSYEGMRRWCVLLRRWSMGS